MSQINVGDKFESNATKGRRVVVQVERVNTTYRIGRKLGFREERVCQVRSLSTGRRLADRTPDQLGRKLEV